eukprot:9392667-Karenia_brevis.AAC.1
MKEQNGQVRRALLLWVWLPIEEPLDVISRVILGVSFFPFSSLAAKRHSTFSRSSGAVPVSTEILQKIWSLETSHPLEHSISFGGTKVLSLPNMQRARGKYLQRRDPKGRSLNQ